MPESMQYIARSGKTQVYNGVCLLSYQGPAQSCSRLGQPPLSVYSVPVTPDTTSEPGIAAVCRGCWGYVGVTLAKFRSSLLGAGSSPNKELRLLRGGAACTMSAELSDLLQCSRSRLFKLQT